MTIPELAEIIKKNPNCVAIIDNDNWSLYTERYFKEVRSGETDEDAHDDDYYDGLYESERIVHYSEIDDDGAEFYGNCYGADILGALALLVGIHVVNV